MLRAVSGAVSGFLIASAFIIEGGSADPLACQPNSEQPMLPIFHIIGNVTKNTDGSIHLEPINDCSGVTYYKGIYHVWHQCCQNHWDHVISKDLIHWQRLPPPIQPVTLKTWDGSITMLEAEDGGPLILYDAQDGKLGSHGEDPRTPLDRPILGVAKLADPDDKYLLKWTRDANNPVAFDGNPISFPGQVWKNGDYYNFIGQGNRFQSNDSSFHSWTNMGPMIGIGEHGGQWWMPVPNQVDGTPPPAGTPNRLVNVNGGATYLFGFYNPENETFTPWSPGGEKPGKEATLERGGADWWGGQGGPGNNGRMMIIGWATPDYGGPAGPGIGFLTRLTLLREVHYDPKLMDLVSNPVPELTGLRTSSMASEKGLVLTSQPHAVQGTGGGAASSADVVISFSGFVDGSVMGACVLANSSFEGLGISLVVSGGTVTAKAGTCSESMKAVTNGGGTSFPLFDDESELQLRILPDRSLADFFVQGGRWSGTISWQAKGPRAAGDSTVAVWSNSTSEVKADIDVFGMGCGWVDPSYTEHPTM